MENNQNITFFNSNQIFNSITNTTQLLFVATGCSMKHYVSNINANNESIEQGYTRIITPENNQQYPLPLHKFQGEKVFIFIDPDMEDIPYLVSMMGLVPTNGLQQHVMQYHGNNMRLFVIKDYIEYNNPVSNNHQLHLQFIFNLVNQCISTGTKMILQDYTGYNTDILYSKVLSQFIGIPKEVMLSQIFFDITQGEGDCMPNFSFDMCNLDAMGHFIQEKYFYLTNHMVQHSPQYIKILKRRLNLLINEISWKYIKLSESPDYEFRFSKVMNYLFHIYNNNNNTFDEDNTDLAYILPRVKNLINNMIQDIVLAQGCDNTIAEHMISILHDRNQFISQMSVMGFE